MRFAKQPQWITFDCYGTLVDTRTHYVKIWYELLAQKGLDADEAVMEYVRSWGLEEFRLVQGPYKKHRDLLVESVEVTLRRNNLPVGPGMGVDWLTRGEPFHRTRTSSPCLRD